jgi:dTDP-L-rhamnose 4-epimerase
MKVLITGGAGFIGSHTADILITNGHEVTVLDNLDRQVHPPGEPVYQNDRADYILGDITSRSVVIKTLKKSEPDAIIHLASRVGIAQSMYELYRYTRTNSLGTSLLYQAILDHPRIRQRVKKIVVASSKTIYGEGSYHCKDCDKDFYPGLRSEDDLDQKIWDFFCPTCGKKLQPVGIMEGKPPQNLSVYALTKYDTERIAVNFAGTFNLPTVAFRYFNVYGPRQSLSNPYTGVSAIFSSRIKNNKPIVIFEDGAQLRDFVYVGDVARANLAAIESPVTGVFNIGSGQPHSITEIALILKKIFRSDVEIKVTGEYRKGDTRHDFADISKASQSFDYKPETDLYRGLSHLVAWSEGIKARDNFEKAENERIRFSRS